jgi:hypothetical protein
MHANLSRGLTLLGALIAVYGVVNIVWSQFGGIADYTNLADRVTTLPATGVLLIGVGALVVIGAQIMGRVWPQETRD